MIEYKYPLMLNTNDEIQDANGVRVSLAFMDRGFGEGVVGILNWQHNESESKYSDEVLVSDNGDCRIDPSIPMIEPIPIQQITEPNIGLLSVRSGRGSKTPAKPELYYEEMVADRKGGMGLEDIAKKNGVNVDWVKRVLRDRGYNDLAKAEVEKRGGGKPKKGDGYYKEIAKDVKEMGLVLAKKKWKLNRAYLILIAKKWGDVVKEEGCSDMVVNMDVNSGVVNNQVAG